MSKKSLNLALTLRHWDYDSLGYCSSCDSYTMFIYSKDLNTWLSQVTSSWKSSSNFKATLMARENELCFFCNANYRMRHHAATVIKLLGMSSAKHLIGRLQKDDSFHTYESAAYNVFRMQKMRKLINYEVSEYFDDKPYGSYVNDIRNENLERLTFPNNRFDVVINSDVLEHVGNLKQALSEIKRVLKPGGFHVFTIPVDYELPRTVERAKITDGKVEYLMEPVMHGDSIRREGVLAFRDFGSDVLDYMSIEGFECKEFKYNKGDKYIASVYYAQKKQ